MSILNNKVIIYCCFVVCFFSVSLCSDCYADESRETYIAKLRDEANQGSVEAKLALGAIYYYGQGAEKNFELASTWYKAAAEQLQADTKKLQLPSSNVYIRIDDTDDYVYGNEHLNVPVDGAELNNLANKYRNGEGVHKDNKRAVELYKKAALAGHAGAQGNLGRIYYFGTMGVKKDYEKAFALLTSSAIQGDRDSQFILGDMYGKGKGTSKDKVRAAQLYRLAAKKGNREAISKYKRYEKYLISANTIKLLDSKIKAIDNAIKNDSLISARILLSEAENIPGASKNKELKKLKEDISKMK